MDSVGNRISCEGQRATIRFIGNVPATDRSCTWLGIEWDDAARGKHSGEHKGVRYFSTSTQGAGSFLKQTNKTIERRRDFVTVLRSKYLANSGDNIVAFGGDENVVVETVGWEKIARAQSQLHLLSEVGLMEMCVGYCAVAGSIRETCGNIVDLDLSKNLVECWNDIGGITVELPLLSSLRLNHNRIVRFGGLEEQFIGCFARLIVLSLNFSMVSWQEMVDLEPHLPALTELHLRHNAISELSACTGFKSLSLLNLEDNLISSFAQVEELKHLPALSSLILANNHLETIAPANLGFTNLRFINLNRNRIKTWSSVHNLNSYPSLTDIRLKQNPICDSIDHPERLHFHLIARLAQVTLLNGSQVTVKARRDAEVYYLNECVGLKGDAGFLEDHQRYVQICGMYGEPERSAKAEAKTVGDGLVGIEFLWEGVSAVKRIPLRMNVRGVKALVKRLLRIVSGKIVLDMDVGEEITRLGDDIKELSYYDVEDGARIIVTVE